MEKHAREKWSKYNKDNPKIIGNNEVPEQFCAIFWLYLPIFKIIHSNLILLNTGFSHFVIAGTFNHILLQLL